MELFRKIITHVVLAVQILLVIVLLFEDAVEAPLWLQSFGRLHPLLLHFPIGILLLTVILVFVRKYFDGIAFDDLVGFLLHLNALTASLSAFMGILLSLEGGYNDNDLLFHKWLGISLSFFCWILLSVQAKPKALKPTLALGVILLILTGHFGANLTHGENFVLGPLQTPELHTRVVTDSSTMFAAAIEPILENRCYSCHNKQKAKGNLVLTSLEDIMKGGEDGALWKSGDPTQSLLIKRLTLPLETKEHMPPKDKTQLTADEIVFISEWIAAGANTKRTLKEFAESDTLKKLSTSIIARYTLPAAQQSRYQFPFVAQQKIQELSTPYRSVFQIARNEPALQADFFLRGSYQKKYLDELSMVKDQVVSLNFSKMPLQDADLKALAQFTNLEKLILNNTDLKGDGLKDLVQLPHLSTVSLSGTNVNVNSLRELAANKNISRVFIWNTPVTKAEAESLAIDFSHIQWELGYLPDEKEMLRLSGSILLNENQVLKEDEKIMLKHNLPGTAIRYSVDGKEPDSVNGPVYDKPLPVDRYTVVKTRSFKEGWLSSNTTEYVFFKKGAMPEKSELRTKPDKQYPGEGVATFTDGKKGMPDFYRDPPWIGFRDEPLEAYFYFDEQTPAIKSVTLSYARNIYAMCMPPEVMEVWAGSDPKDLKLLQRIKPVQPDGYLGTRIEGATVDLPEGKYACYKIVAKPLAKLPEFRKAGKKDKGWLMVDEIFFN
jgi:hypothetical protein